MFVVCPYLKINIVSFNSVEYNQDSKLGYLGGTINYTISLIKYAVLHCMHYKLHIEGLYSRVSICNFSENEFLMQNSLLTTYASVTLISNLKTII